MNEKQQDKKKRRWRPGTVAKREIRKLTKSTKLLFPRLPFNRLVREICQDLPNGCDKHFTKNAMAAFQVRCLPTMLLCNHCNVQ